MPLLMVDVFFFLNNSCRIELCVLISHVGIRGEVVLEGIFCRGGEV